jgi:hypothetical protein
MDLDYNKNQEDIDSLAEEWLRLKESEDMLYNKRNDIEKQILEFMPETEEVKTIHLGSFYDVKISTSEKYVIEHEPMQKIASEFGLEHEMFFITRWKPELKLANFKKLDEDKRKILSCAITITKQKPTITITKGATK